ncbi:MAG: hypothetical protein Kow00127_10230 [Bacteroidales bacterium]
MKKRLHLLILLLVAGSLTITSCNKNEDDDNNNNNTPQEYVATDSDFNGFRNWTLVAENQGPDPALGEAHAGNDSTVTRYIYFKDNAVRVNGAYPVGTIIVKESYNDDNSVHEYTAMVKRGNSFNPSGGDWEWFMLAGEGEIAKDQDGNPMRGADLMGGMCIGCHSQASDRDYAFSKP